MRTADRYCKWGVFYVNSDDLALSVKQLRSGYTLDVVAAHGRLSATALLGLYITNERVLP